MSEHSLDPLLVRLLAGAAVVTALFFAKPLLMPLALALLAAFCLAPAVRRLEELGIGRVAAVAATTLGVAAILFGVGWAVGSEIGEVAERAPEYRRHLAVKLEALQAPLHALGRANDVVDDIERELAPRDETRRSRSESPLEVVQGTTPLQTLLQFTGSVLGSLALAGVVVVLTMFLLVSREELRDRTIRLAGPERIPVVTFAIDDIAERLSRYLGTLGVLCALHAALVSLGLALLGIPGALLWGVLAGALRVVPYLGPWLGASAPILLAFAAFPGWSPGLTVACFFVALELLTNNLLEPWLYGSSTGLSPLAIVLSAFFWTWLWGTPGLFLAVPLTACLVVLGRYVQGLAFLPTLLGAEPVLPVELRLYQRLISLDAAGSRELLEEAEAGSRDADALVRRCRERLERDVARGAVRRERAEEVRALAASLLAETGDETAPGAALGEPAGSRPAASA